MTGRAEEMRLIHAAVGRGVGTRGIVLAGAAGVGKTRLAREAVSSERVSTFRRWVAATASGQPLPLGAFASVLGEIDGAPTQLLGRAIRVLLHTGGGRELLIVVDDAHLLDELSALLVHQLVLRNSATVVVTVRTGEVCPDPVTALWKDGLLDRLEIQPFSESETAALAEAALHGPVERASIARMWHMTRGNALFLRQLIDGELDAGRLSAIRGIWRWSAGGPGLSARLTELVVARMGALSGSVRDVVDLLALAEPLSVSMLGDLTEARALEQAETAGLVDIGLDGRRKQARLAHPLFGEARRAQIGHLRASRLRGMVTAAIGATGARRTDDPLRRAVLSIDSDIAPDPSLLAAAAELSMRLLGISLAERLARAAVSADGRVDARFTLSFALSWLSRGQDAELELAALAAVAGADPLRTRTAMLRAANMFWVLREPASGQAILESAEAQTDDDSCRHSIGCMRSAFDAVLGQPDLAVREAMSALSFPELPDQAIALASWGLVVGLGTAGRIDEATVAATEGYVATSRSFDAAILRYPLTALHMIVLRLAGHVTQMQTIADERRAESLNIPDLSHRMGVVIVALAELANGRLRTAVRWFEEALGALPHPDDGWRSQCLPGLTEARAMLGDSAAAKQAAAEMDREFHPGFSFLEPQLVLARAWVAASEGALSEAMTLAHQAADLGAASGQLAHEVLALHTAVRFGDRTVAARLTRLSRQVGGPRAAAAAVQAVALAADDGIGLQLASAQFEAAGDLLAAADAAAQAAVAYERQQARREAQMAAARAHRLADACEGAKTPALIHAAHPLPLSVREREIVGLAAEGHSNRAIADRLVVSVRTVEGHLYRAFAKLGTSNRAELTDLLQDG